MHIRDPPMEPIRIIMGRAAISPSAVNSLPSEENIPSLVAAIALNRRPNSVK